MAEDLPMLSWRWQCQRCQGTLLTIRDTAVGRFLLVLLARELERSLVDLVSRQHLHRAPTDGEEDTACCCPNGAVPSLEDRRRQMQEYDRRNDH